QALESWYAYFPGLKVVMPSTPADAKGLLKSAIRDDDPVIFIEQERMYGMKGEVPEDDNFTIPLGVAEVKREGTEATIVARSLMVPIALKAAEELAKDGVSCEVIDPRTIRPLDINTIVESVKKTNRVLRKILINEGESAPLGQPIAIIGEPGEDISSLLKETAGKAAEPAETPAAKEAQPATKKTTPAAKEAAKESEPAAPEAQTP